MALLLVSAAEAAGRFFFHLAAGGSILSMVLRHPTSPVLDDRTIRVRRDDDIFKGFGGERKRVSFWVFRDGDS